MEYLSIYLPHDILYYLKYNLLYIFCEYIKKIL